MTELLSLPWYIYVVPVCAVVAAVSVSKLFNISRLVSFIGAFAPLALPYSEISVSQASVFAKPHMQVLGGWGAMLAGAAVWVVLRAILKSTRGPLGLFRLAFSVLLFAAGLVVVLLITNPEALTTYVPKWRESAGTALLSATVVGMGLYFIRLFKSAALLVLCSAASIILASQVFFAKMPYELGDDELSRIEKVLPSSVPKEIVESGVKSLVKASSSTRKILRTASSDDVES